MKLISVVSPCYNEEGNVKALTDRVRDLFAQVPQYRYEHIIADNNSSDSTVEILRGIAALDPNVKIIVNTRNFGHLRSPQHALMEAQGDAVVVLLSDLQDPPELILEFLREWEAGFPVVVAVKSSSDENGLMYKIRSGYYKLVARLTDVKVLEHFTGFGLYDRKVMDVLRKDFRDPYPYFRGQIAEMGSLKRSFITIKSGVQAALRRIISTACMTWPFSASRICPKFHSGWWFSEALSPPR